MGLLDDLEQQAAHARERRTEQDAGSRERERAEQARLAPALERATQYFERLAAHLLAIERVIETRYEIPDLGTLDALVQTGYATTTEARDGRPSVRFHFRCEGPTPLEGRLASDAAAASAERTLRDVGLFTRRGDNSGRAGVLRVEPKVPVSLVFAMDLERGGLLFTARNLFGIGVQTHCFEAQRVDTQLLDAIGHCVLREPSQFTALTGNTVSDEQRQRLARDAARHIRSREAELGGSFGRAWFHVVEAFRRVFRGQ